MADDIEDLMREYDRDSVLFLCILFIIAIAVAILVLHLAGLFILYLAFG